MNVQTHNADAREDRLTSPRVSIVITAYNVAKYVGQTLDAALSQSYPHCDVTVVDDGSTDGTAEVLAGYADRVQVIRQPNFGGPSRPRNVGIAATDGDLVALCDGDDVLKPEAIASAVDVFANLGGIDLVWGDFAYVDGHGNPDGLHWSDKYTDVRDFFVVTDLPGCFLLPPDAAFEGLLRGLFLGASSIVMRRTTLDRIGPFDESLRNGDDRDMWLRFARCGAGFAFRQTVCFDYRIHAGSISNRGPERLPSVIRVLEKQWPHIQDPHLQREVTDKLHALRLSFGLGLARSGEGHAARSVLWRCYRERPSWGPLRGMLRSVGKPR
jgi:glycosyltransferase involved in cell wall biosynthesis